MAEKETLEAASAPVVDQIIAAVDSFYEPVVCETCGDTGWYFIHEDECYDSGSCVCAGLREPCDCPASATAADAAS